MHVQNAIGKNSDEISVVLGLNDVLATNSRENLIQSPDYIQNLWILTCNTEDFGLIP